MKEFFNTLFEPEEGICTGSAKATQVYKYPKEGEFFCVNPLSTMQDYGWFLNTEKYNKYVPRRADLNVSAFRNFIFEMDSMPLEDQLVIFRECSIPFTTIVYSGSKSYHAILAVEDTVVKEVHTTTGIDEYKHIWKRLSARINQDAKKLGYEYPDHKGTFIDESCKNPSRLTRYPEVARDNGNVQTLVQLTDRMNLSEFLSLLSECPVVLSSRKSSYENVPEDELQTIEEFEAICPDSLRRKLKIVDWGASEGMYPYLRDYTLWAIDSTNVSKEVFEEYLNKYTFASLLRYGYPRYKLMVAVEHAYKMKGK